MFAADRIHISPPANTDEHDREHHLADGVEYGAT